MDNFKGQVTASVSSLLEANNIHVCLLPANTTDRLQPMDISVNKPGKDFLKRRFEAWYAEEIQKQLDGNDIESTELAPVDLSLPRLKVLGAKWILEMFHYLSHNPQIVVRGFQKAGIAGAVYGCEESDERQTDEDEAILVYSDESESDEGQTDEDEATLVYSDESDD